MDERKKVEIRQSEIRSRLSEIIPLERTAEVSGEMDTLNREYQENERTLRAAIVASDGQPVATYRTEDKERADLFTRASVGDLVHGLMNGRSGVDGAMAELQREYGFPSNSLHVRQLGAWRDGGPERLTRAVTPGAADVGQQQQAIIPWVFPQACAAFLGVDMPTVGIGDAVFPVLTKQLDVRTPNENASADETTGSFSADVLSPSRIQAAFFYSREDRARFAGMDASLRENLEMGLGDGLDAEIIAGTNGLLTGANLANNNQGTVTDWDDFLSQFGYGRVDGRYASMAGDLRIVMGSDTYAKAGTTYRAAETDETALERLMRITGGVKVSAHVTDLSGANKQDNIIRRGMARDMVAPIWENIDLIPDEVTKAATGQIVITAVMMHAVKILRADGFHKQQVQTA